MRPLHLLVWPASPGEAVQKVVQLQKSKIGTKLDGNQPRKGLLPPPVGDWGKLKKYCKVLAVSFFRFGGIHFRTAQRRACIRDPRKRTGC